MRFSADWMNIWDDRILEILDGEGPMPVGKIASHEAVHTSKSTVSRRCRKLAENGFLQEIGNGVYSISDIGKAYLNGEFDAESETFIDVEESGTDSARQEGTNGA